jgi:hypothetical protein
MAAITLRSDVSTDAFLEASERLEREFLGAQPGYLGRALTQDAQGRWMDVVLWADRESAEAILPKISGSEACAAYFGCMQGADVATPDAGIAHWHVARAFGAFAVT